MSIHELLYLRNFQFVEVALLITRLLIGSCFVVHGLGKLGIVGPGNMKGFEQWLASMNLPMPALQARLAMLAELLGGSLVALGFMTRFGCLLCFSTMIVAGLIGHKGGGYLITNNPPGNEYTINLAIICVLIFALGGGSYSIDSWFFAG